MAGRADEDERAAAGGGSLREGRAEDLGRLIGLLTHDLRNPLAALSSNVGFLQMVGRDLPEEAREAIDDLQLSVEALGRMSDVMELLSHNLEDRPAPQPTVVDVAALVRQLEGPGVRSAKSHEVSVRFDTEGMGGQGVRAPHQALTLVLASLLHNSLSVSPRGSEVVFRVLPRGGGVVFRVEDQGPRLSPAMLEKVSALAGQNDLKSNRAARYSRGLGLLAVCLAARRAGVELAIGSSDRGSALEVVVPTPD